ncbi:hypothetical protein ACOSQ4_029016 [Xanthoceras sorbifolium]
MLKKEEMEVFRGVLWRSWYRRKQYLMDFRAANRRPEPMAVEQRPALVWKPSTRGLFKFNVDAAVSFPLNLVRLGVVVCDFKGRVMIAGAKRVVVGWSPQIAKAAAISHGLTLASEPGLSPVTLFMKEWRCCMHALRHRESESNTAGVFNHHFEYIF